MSKNTNMVLVGMTACLWFSCIDLEGGIPGVDAIKSFCRDCPRNMFPKRNYNISFNSSLQARRNMLHYSFPYIRIACVQKCNLLSGRFRIKWMTLIQCISRFKRSYNHGNIKKKKDVLSFTKLSWTKSLTKSAHSKFTVRLKSFSVKWRGLVTTCFQYKHNSSGPSWTVVLVSTVSITRESPPVYLQQHNHVSLCVDLWSKCCCKSCVHAQTEKPDVMNCASVLYFFIPGAFPWHQHPSLPFGRLRWMESIFLDENWRRRMGKVQSEWGQTKIQCESKSR